ncbi:VanZ family protein [Niallia nealsonii]|nr:VanZ family protein [Niallia nealsonii]
MKISAFTLRKYRAPAILLFTLYLVVLFYLLFFSGYRQSVYGLRGYNYLPLLPLLEEVASLNSFGLSFITSNLFGNVLAFLPLGFFAAFFTKKNVSAIIMMSFLLSFSIEMLQFIFAIGICDINDILLNTIGGALGYCLFYLTMPFLVKKQ